MLVKFLSSETGELIMFADPARQILTACGKKATARGAFTVEEIPAALARLRQVLARGETSAAPAKAADACDGEDAPIDLGRRAWPFIDMLERTAQGGPKANILWEAPSDF